VDTKKKEWVGDFKNSGRELRPQGDPGVRDVNVEVWQFLFLWPYSLRSDTLGQEVPFAETPCQPGTGAISDSH
jgi:hypothetical protein